jgi:hypothetical protein
LRRIGKAGLDRAIFQRCDYLRQPTHLNNGHIRAALESVMLEKNSRRRIT